MAQEGSLPAICLLMMALVFPDFAASKTTDENSCAWSHFRLLDVRDKNFSARQDVFDNCTKAEQLNIYLENRYRFHPPVRHFELAFIHEGEQAAEAILHRLKSEAEEEFVVEMIYLLARIKRKRSYDVSQNADAVRLIRNRIENMKLLHLKQSAQEQLSNLLER